MELLPVVIKEHIFTFCNKDTQILALTNRIVSIRKNMVDYLLVMSAIHHKQPNLTLKLIQLKDDWHEEEYEDFFRYAIRDGNRFNNALNYLYPKIEDTLPFPYHVQLILSNPYLSWKIFYEEYWLYWGL